MKQGYGTKKLILGKASGRYQRPVRDGISMAKKLKTVDMLELPIPAAEVIQ